MKNSKPGKESPGKNSSAYRRVGFWLSTFTAILIVLGIIILTALPYAMEWGAERMLIRYGAGKASIADVDFNPMTGYLRVFDLKVQGPGSEKVSMERLVVKVDLLPIFKKRINFHQISLTGLFIDLKRHEDGTLSFGGFPVVESNDEKAEEIGTGQAPVAWGFGIRKLDIKELSVHIATTGLEEAVFINHISLAGFRTWEPENTGDYVLRVDLLGGSLDIEGEARPFMEKPGFSARIGLRDLPLDRITPYLGDTPLESLTGTVSGRGNINTTIDLEPMAAAAVTFSLDIFSRDINIKTDSGGMVLDLTPGALNAGITVTTAVQAVPNSPKKADFTFTSALEGSTSRVLNGGTDIEIRQDKMDLEVAGSYSDTGDVDSSEISARGGLSLMGVSVKEGDGPARLLDLGSLSVEDASISGPDEINVSRASLDNIAILTRPAGSIGKDEPGHVLSLENITVTDIEVSGGSRLTVDNIQLASLDAWLLRKEGGNFEAMDILEAVTGQGTRTSEESRPDEGSDAAEDGVEIALGSILLTGENSLIFKDLDVSPPFNYTIDSLALEVLNLDTAAGARTASVSLQMGMGKYSTMTVDSTVQPPLKTPDLDMKVRIKSIDLPPLTPYTTRYLGYILNSGHLNTEVDMVIKDGDLDAQTEVLVNRIEMEAVKAEDEQRAEDRLGIPVQTALSLLKDNNDDIRLRVPVKGDLEDPQFKISDVIVSATGLALKKGVTAYYKDLGATLLTGGIIPPGTFSLFGKIFSGVTTVTFEPVIFNPLAIELDESSKTYLTLMAEKLESKPKARLVLCGKVTSEDIDALRQADFEAAQADAVAASPAQVSESEPVTSDTQEGTAYTGGISGDSGDASGSAATGPPSIEEVPLSEEEKERLIELAKLRALAVKDYLAESGGLNPERLFVCYSDVEIEGEGLPPRVDMSI